MTKQSPDKPSVPSVDDLRRQVEGTREELGQTVAALAAKADIKSRVTQKKAQVTSHMQDRAAHARRQLTGSANILGDRLRDEAPKRPGKGSIEREGVHASTVTRSLLSARSPSSRSSSSNAAGDTDESVQDRLQAGRSPHGGRDGRCGRCTVQASVEAHRS